MFIGAPFLPELSWRAFVSRANTYVDQLLTTITKSRREVGPKLVSFLCVAQHANVQLYWLVVLI